MHEAPPVGISQGLAHLTEPMPAYAGCYLHQWDSPVHTHSFVEIAFAVSGTATHHSQAGRREMQPGDVLLLRPGVWHGYQDCRLRLFNAATGLPPMAYLGQLRAEHAAVLLLHSDEPVTSIGRAVGWPDQSGFARRFKAHYGLSATTYRKRFATRSSRLHHTAAVVPSCVRSPSGPSPAVTRHVVAGRSRGGGDG